MTNNKTIKFLAILTALIMLFAIACKNKTTASTILSGEMPIDLTQDVSQFEGKTFRSVDALDGGNISYLWVDISENSTIKYKADNKSNADFSTAAETIIVKGLGQNYVFSGKSSKGAEQNGTFKFDPDGTLTVYFASGTSYDKQTIKCKLSDLLK